MEKLIVTLLVSCLVLLAGVTGAACLTGAFKDVSIPMGLQRFHHCPPHDRSPGCPMHGVP